MARITEHPFKHIFMRNGMVNLTRYDVNTVLYFINIAHSEKYESEKVRLSTIWHPCKVLSEKFIRKNPQIFKHDKELLLVFLIYKIL